MSALPEQASDLIKQLVKTHGLTDYVDAADTPPPVPGVYLCKTVGLVDTRELFSRFDGRNWSYGYSSPDAAADANCLAYLSRPGNLTRYWRGLASDPSVPVDKASKAKSSLVLNLTPRKS